MFDHPVSTQYLDNQIARGLGALPAAGAYDATLVEMPCAGFKTCTLFFDYTRGGAAGGFAFKLEVSPHSTGTEWEQGSIYGAQPVAGGADTRSDIQREEIEYVATAAAAERFVYGPFDIRGIERLRVPCHETGNAGAPGALQIDARFAC